MKNNIQDYKELVTEQEEMARKIFNVKTVEYDNNGRIIKMKYEEKLPSRH